MTTSGIHHQKWLKAAVAGGLWASVEIIIGSFLHNMRIPFAGAVLASFGVMLMVAFNRLWPERGLIWRAGLVCALMKSISPSATLLGPMVGIFAESLVLEFFIRLFGSNIPSFLIAGGFAVMTAFAQKLFNILIIYGLNLVQIYTNLLDYVARQLGYQAADPWALIIILFSIYFGLGFLASLSGIIISTKVGTTGAVNLETPALDQRKIFAQSDVTKRYSVWLLALNIAAIPSGIILIGKADFILSSVTVLVYMSFMLWRYPYLYRRLLKPMIWVQLIILVLLSGVFYRSSDAGELVFSAQGLWVGVQMCLRAIVVISGFSGVSHEMSNPVVRQVLFSKGFSHVYTSVALAFKALPAILEMAPRPSVFFRQPLTSVAQMLNMADQLRVLMQKEQYQYQ